MMKYPGVEKPGRSHALAAVVAVGLGLAAACGSAGGEYREGGLYSVADEQGFGVVKVLVVQPEAVHIRVYKDKFEVRPLDVEEDDLSMGGIGDPDGFGMGHLPLSRPSFDEWKPELIKVVPIQEAELEGFRIWEEAGGGLF